MTALATPFTNNGVDINALENLIRFQIDSGINGLVPCGSTGEAATMTFEEKRQVIKATVKISKGRAPVIAGAGTNNTATTIDLCKMAQDQGADGVLVVAPFYNKPTQGGLIKHFEAAANSVSIPVVLYDVPGRTGTSISPKTVIRLSRIKNIIAIKDASGNVNNAIEILHQAPDFIILSGDDSLYLPFLSIGAKGIISVTSNVVPKKMADIFTAWEAKEYHEAKRLFYKLWPLFNAMFFESNPIPVKAALSIMNKIEPATRLPLTPISETNLNRLIAVLKQMGVI